jgi:hypothetical protein
VRDHGPERNTTAKTQPIYVLPERFLDPLPQRGIERALRRILLQHGNGSHEPESLSVAPSSARRRSSGSTRRKAAAAPGSSPRPCPCKVRMVPGLLSCFPWAGSIASADAYEQTTTPARGKFAPVGGATSSPRIRRAVTRPPKWGQNYGQAPRGKRPWSPSPAAARAGIAPGPGRLLW